MMNALYQRDFVDTCCQAAVASVSIASSRRLDESFAASVDRQEVAFGSSVGRSGAWNPGWLVGLVGNFRTGYQLERAREVAFEARNAEVSGVIRWVGQLTRSAQVEVKSPADPPSG